MNSYAMGNICVCQISDVTSEILFKSIASDEVQASLSKIIQYFQLQNHEYCYSGVSIVLCFGFSAPSLRLFIYTHNIKYQI